MLDDDGPQDPSGLSVIGGKENEAILCEIENFERQGYLSHVRSIVTNRVDEVSSLR